MSIMIVVVDYGMGNTASIANMLRYVGGEAIISNNERDVVNAKALILPGVGSFDNGINKLRDSGLLWVLKDQVLSNGIPFLGICLGMQLLFEKSEEGLLPGLGWLPGVVRRFAFAGSSVLRIPHMGWNVVYPKYASPLFLGLSDKARFYFVHSYHVVCDEEDHILATANYGYNFPCAIRNRNIYGVQFHPEKSHKFGMALLANFLQKIC